MSIAWVQGAGTTKGNTGNGSIPLTITGVGAGNALVLSVGMLGDGTIFVSSLIGNCQSITDNRGNVYQLAAVSPVQYNDPGQPVGGKHTTMQIATFVALNCVGGDTTISIGGGASFLDCFVCAGVDEFSGVYRIRAVDGVTFASTVFESGATEVVSGDITINGDEMVYSCGLDDLASDTLTPSAGYTQRQSETTSFGVFGMTFATFTKAYSGGTASNTITPTGAPNGIHVTLIALSSAEVDSTILQTGWAVANGITLDHVSAPFPFDTEVGSLLIATCYVHERGTFAVTDTQGNDWTTFDIPNSSSPAIAIAYTPSAAGGANTVTMTGTTGGNDDTFVMVIAEYKYKNVAFIGESHNIADLVSSIDTGNVVSSAASSLLVSVMTGQLDSLSTPDLGGKNTPSPGTWQYQISDTGLFGNSLAQVVLSDQVVSSPGTYNNVFTPTVSTNDLAAVILGFDISIVLACPLANTGQIDVEYSSALIVTGGVPPYTFEIISGALPAGVTLNDTTGLISGTPTEAGVFIYTAKVTDDLGSTATATCSIVISAGRPSICGEMPTLEVTRDLNCDWTDSSTFYITQDTPMPFTLRALVLRMSYNQD